MFVNDNLIEKLSNCGHLDSFKWRLHDQENSVLFYLALIMTYFINSNVLDAE